MTDNWQMRAIAAEALNHDLEEENERLRVENATLRAKLEGKEPPTPKEGRWFKDLAGHQWSAEEIRELMMTPPTFKDMDFSKVEMMSKGEMFKAMYGRFSSGSYEDINIDLVIDEAKRRYYALMRVKQSDRLAQQEVDLRYLEVGDTRYLSHVAESLCRSLDRNERQLVDRVAQALETLCKRKGLIRDERHSYQEAYYRAAFDTVPTGSKPEPKPTRKRGAGRTRTGDTGSHPRSPFQRGGGKS